MATTSPPPDDPPPDETHSAYYGGPLGAGIDWADPNSRLAPLYMTAGGVVGVVVVGLVFVLLGTVPLWHTDFWGHLKYGEWIAANRTVPDREPLSPFTDKHARMFDPLWLTQLGYHGVFRAGAAVARGDAQRQFEGGVEAVRLLHLFAAVGTVGLLGLAYRRVSGSVGWAVGGMLIALVLMLAILSVQRPQAFALTCFAAVLFGLSRPVPSRRAVVWIPLVLVLWANLHGSFVVGIGLVGAVLVGRVVELVRGEGGSVRAVWHDPAVRRLTLIVLLSGAGTAFLNPDGPAVFLDVKRFGDHPNLRTLGEWQPLDFSQPRGGHWLYLGTLVLLVATQAVSPRPFTPAQLILVLTLGVAPLFQQRMMAWWAMVVPWVVAPHWVAAAAVWGYELPAGVPSFRKTALAALLAVVLVVISQASTWLKTGRPRPAGVILQPLPPDVIAAAPELGIRWRISVVGLHPGTPADIAAALMGELPPDAIDRAFGRATELARVVREDHGGRFTGRVFASETQGDYLLWALPPEAPVMMFNHAQLFTPEYWGECMTVKQGGPGWWEILDRHRASAVVVEAAPHAELCRGLRAHPAWRVVVDEADAPARDESARLFVAVRRPAPTAGNAP